MTLLNRILGWMVDRVLGRVDITDRMPRTVPMCERCRYPMTHCRCAS